MRNWLRRIELLLPGKRRRRREALDEELAEYLELAKRAARASGLEEKEAAEAARRDLGNITRAREDVRSEWLPPKLEHFVQDLVYLGRTLRRESLFALIAIGTLGLGIGAANVVFSLVDGILIKPLSYARPGELVYLQEFVPPLAHVYPTIPVNFQHFRYWEEHSKTFQRMAAFRATLTGTPPKVTLRPTMSGSP